MNPLQFSLRFLLAAILAWAVALSLAFQFPHQAFFAAAIAAMMLIPLLTSTAILRMLRTVQLIKAPEPNANYSSPFVTVRSLLRRTSRILGLSTDRQLPIRSAAWKALVATLVLIGLWPIVRWFALETSWPVISHEPISRTWNRIVQSSHILDARSWRGVWLPEWKKEFVEVSKWWLLLGAIAIAWSIASGTITRRRLAAPRSDTFARLLAFAPWLIVLEVGLLGAGIFSWKLWFGYVWLKYLNFSMVVHAAVPILLVGLAFSRSVLRARWIASAAVAVCFVALAEFVSLFLALFTERNPAIL